MSQPPITFDAYQQAIIDRVFGGILVLAPVGTGKTTVLTERLVNAIQQGIAPGRVLSVTFTNRAAQEMQTRVRQRIPGQFKQITIKTFHGLCAYILRVEAANVGLPADFAIYTDSDCIELVKAVFSIPNPKTAEEVYRKLQDCKTNVSPRKLQTTTTFEELYQFLDHDNIEGAIAYQTALQSAHALDFADLVYYLRAMLRQRPEIRDRWQNRFDFVQVDEVQDTHIAEYEIIQCLAGNSGNLAMIGDMDQSIYGWRGSEPERVLQQFREDFSPAEYELVYNYRATRALIAIASGFANCFENRFTNVQAAATCPDGEPVAIQNCANEIAETFWVARQIKSLTIRLSDFQYKRTAILVRTHQKAEFVSRVLTQEGIPCVTVEQYAFFERKEIKNALAFLQVVTNPNDLVAFKRIACNFLRGIGKNIINQLTDLGQDCGLQLTDFALPRPFVNQDPLGEAIRAYREDILIVFDVETTGISVENDVIEIAATKLIRGEVVDQFHGFISDAEPVDDSAQIHGYSNAYLAEHGESAKIVFTAFRDFIGDALVVGHNVGFDIKMVTAHAQKVGVMYPKLRWADTWDLAKRFLREEHYSLEYLAQALNLASTPSHRATDDVATTVELLHYLMPTVEAHSTQRQAIVQRYGKYFTSLAKKIAAWTDLSFTERPSALLSYILQDSGLQDTYQRDQDRLQNLLALLNLVSEKDDLDLSPYTALRSLLEFTALSQNIDHLAHLNDQIPIITVHQSKGLEFDTVFIVGMNECEFPTFHSIRDDNIEEEKRLFYVALTRAKQRLFISSANADRSGRALEVSRFMSFLS